MSDETCGDQWGGGVRSVSVPAAYLKELFEERVGGQAKVTIDEERDKVEQKSSRGDIEVGRL